MERRVDLDEPDDSSADELEFESGDDLDLVEEDLDFSDWTHVDNHSDRYANNDSTFFGLHGMHPRFDDVEPKNALFFCNTLLPDELFDFLAHCTNVRAEIHIAESTTSSRLSRWSPTNAQELRKFFACLLLIGVVRKPRTDMYWSTAKSTVTVEANPSRRCRVCTTNGLRKETRLFCSSCDENPSLCAFPCFNIWHKYD